jgi:hypothetical protein
MEDDSKKPAAGAVVLLFQRHSLERKNHVSEQPTNRRGEKVKKVQRNRSGSECPSAFFGEETVEAPVQKNRAAKARQRD